MAKDRSIVILVVMVVVVVLLLVVLSERNVYRYEKRVDLDFE